MTIYIIVSYLIGLALFITDGLLADKTQLEAQGMGMRLYMLMLAPLLAWYGVLHYLQLGFCKLTGRPIKYWF
jgi:hypothetical protein